MSVGREVQRVKFGTKGNLWKAVDIPSRFTGLVLRNGSSVS